MTEVSIEYETSWHRLPEMGRGLKRVLHVFKTAWLVTC
ncbi:MAG: hypothetical protein H6R15_2684 [Proteobacteria bacterium]|nr:hypothetical protein [Pseudomonadota bacterium]